MQKFSLEQKFCNLLTDFWSRSNLLFKNLALFEKINFLIFLANLNFTYAHLKISTYSKSLFNFAFGRIKSILVL